MPPNTPDPRPARRPVPVMLIHGMWCTAADWAMVAQILNARGFDCHAPTLPGHEPTPDQPLQVAGRSLRDYLGHLEAEYDAHYADEPPVLIGHSMGGLLAQQLAARRPCAALVLLTPALPSGFNMLAWNNLRALWPAFLRWGFWSRAFKIDRQTAGWAAFNGIHEARHERLYQGRVHESGRALSEIAMWWADVRRASRVAPGGVQCPVYIVAAGNDCLTPSRHVRKLRRRYPWARFRFYPERGHWVIDDEHTEEMMNGICSWLRPFEAQRPIPVASRPGGAA